MRIIPYVVLLALCGLLAAAVPTDNPVASYYSGPEGYPAWTDQVRWGSVIDMSRYGKGHNDFEKFEAARDELARGGGGVLYYPAGTYDFKDAPADGPNGRGLMLRSGVVIRGEAPAGHPSAAKDGKLELKTVFRFGMQQKVGHAVPRDWNIIGLSPDKGKRISDVQNVGIAWVKVIGGAVYFGPDLQWGATWGQAKSWKSPYAKRAWASRVPDGTHPGDPFLGAPGTKDGGKLMGSGRGRLVFGCVFEQSAVMNDYDTCGRAEAPQGFGEDGFHMAKFAARVAVYGNRVFIANNMLPKSEGNFLYEQTTVQTESRSGNNFYIGKPRRQTVMWDYGRTCGIDVNKEFFGLLQEPLLKESARGFHEEGVVVIDNWVWNHGHKGYNISGSYGTVRNNRNERAFQKGADDVYGLGGAFWRLTLDGCLEASAGGGGMISDNLSRAFDMAGANLWIDANSFNNTGSNPGNDGEGILCQVHGGTHIHSWAITNNVNEGSPGGNNKGLMGGWDCDCLGLLVAWNTTEGYAGTLYRKGNQLADVAVIGNKAGRTLPLDDKRNVPAADGTGTPIYTAPKAAPAAPTQVKAVAYQGDAVRVSWVQKTGGMIAFRVQRKIDNGPWTTIAYRPPFIEGTPANPQDWVDFTAPSDKKLTYRVVAVYTSPDTADGAASAPTSSVTLKARKGRSIWQWLVDRF